MDIIMNDLGNLPILLSVKPLITQFSNFEKLAITSRNFTIGRGLQNSLVIPFISISRNHCTFKNIQDKEWILEDNSSFGIEVNHQKLGKNISKKLNDGDIISFEPSGEFIYKFVCPSPDDYETPNKRIKREPKSPEGNNILDDVKIKFEESQSCEIRHIENKIQNAKDMKTASLILKGQLQLNMKKKIHQLEKEFATQIENLKGEKNDVEKQKALLIAERNIQLQVIKEEMQGKINELLNQIKKHNETESELLKENSLLKEKLTKEREEFLLELNRENTSKQDLLERLECKVREQEENFLIEKQELEKVLRKEVEQLRSTKEKELKDLVELKQQRETELREELDSMKKNLQEQLELTEQQKLQVQQDLNKQLETMKQLSNMENAKIEQLLKEREEIQKTLHEAQISAQKSLEELQERVSIRETELAALAADRIQKQSEQSCEVILNLQEQLEMVKNQLQSVENEKDSLLKNINATENLGEGTSKQTTLTRVGELIESELQCSICAELFVEATTLNCSHTFCKYCITMWKKKKKDCPICRAPITSECRSLVLDTFIDKMVQNLTEEMKVKRQDILKHRADCESELAQKNNARSRGRSDIDESDYDDSQEDYEGEEEEESNNEIYDSDHIFYWGTPSSDFESSDLDLDSSGASNEFSTTSRDAAGSVAPLGGPTGHNANSVGSRRGRYVEGTPGAYYGGYGHCFRCGARGHWATGCPYR